MRVNKVYSLFDMKEKMAELSREIDNDRKWLVQKNKEGYAVPTDEMKERMAHRDNLSYELEVLKAQHDELEAQQLGQVKAQFARGGGASDETIKNKAAFYRAALAGGDVRKAYAGLGAIPVADPDLGGGDRFLPTNLSNQLILEPVVENPMRSIVRMSNVTGLEEPRLTFMNLDGAYDDTSDKDVAKELEMKGDTIVYGRHKVKVMARVSDTVIHGTDTNLVTEIENGLRNGLAVNEMARMFAKSPGEGFEEMSFYSTQNGVKEVNGSTKQEAIAKALADLPLAYRRNASIVMNAIDWFTMWRDNLNQSGTFFQGQPLTLFGKAVVLVDDADVPVVGDFSFCRINYDINSVYDTDKDVEAGIYKFVLTAWYDIKLRLASAFRLAKVQA